MQLLHLLCYTSCVSLLPRAFAYSPEFSNRILHERREQSIEHTRRRVAHDSIIPLRIALRQTNLDYGEELLANKSDPDSSDYGKQMS